MVAKSAIVSVGGQLQELPTGDTLPAGSGANIATADVVFAAEEYVGVSHTEALTDVSFSLPPSGHTRSTNAVSSSAPWGPYSNMGGIGVLSSGAYAICRRSDDSAVDLYKIVWVDGAATLVWVDSVALGSWAEPVCISRYDDIFSRTLSGVTYVYRVNPATDAIDFLFSASPVHDTPIDFSQCDANGAFYFTMAWSTVHVWYWDGATVTKQLNYAVLSGSVGRIVTISRTGAWIAWFEDDATTYCSIGFHWRSGSTWTLVSPVSVAGYTAGEIVPWAVMSGIGDFVAFTKATGSPLLSHIYRRLPGASTWSAVWSGDVGIIRGVVYPWSDPLRLGNTEGGLFIFNNSNTPQGMVGVLAADRTAAQVFSYAVTTSYCVNNVLMSGGGYCGGDAINTLQVHMFTRDVQVWGPPSKMGEDTFVVTPISATWVQSTTKLFPTLYSNVEEALAQDIQLYCANINPGVGFDLIAVAPDGAVGTYGAKVIGV